MKPANQIKINLMLILNLHNNPQLTITKIQKIIKPLYSGWEILNVQYAIRLLWLFEAADSHEVNLLCLSPPLCRLWFERPQAMFISGAQRLQARPETDP